MTMLFLSLRRLRADRATALALAALIALSAFVAATAPRLLSAVADRALRGELERTAVSERSLTFTTEGSLTFTADRGRNGPYDVIDAEGRRLVSELPDVLVERLRAPASMAESARWVARTAVATPGTIRFRFQAGALDRIRFSLGRAPTGATSVQVVAGQPGDPPIPVLLVEGALSTASAEQLGVNVGDEIRLDADVADLLGRQGQGDAVAMRVVGIFTVTDPDDPFWFDDRALVAPSVRDVNSNLAYVDATALLAEAAYAPFSRRDRALTPVRYAWRMEAIIERIDRATAAELTAALRRVESRHPTVAAASGDVASSSGLRRLLERQADTWRVAETILAILATGCAAVVLAAIGLVARMLGARRRSSLALYIGRGATGRQVVGSAVAEGAVLALPASALGLGLTALLVPGDGWWPSLIGVAAVAAASIVMVGVAIATMAGGQARGDRGAGASPMDRVARRRRVVLEGSIVALALLGVVLLRTRGVGDATAIVGAEGFQPSFDPLIAAVPALAGLAAGIVTVRSIRLPLRAAAAAAGLGRGLASSLAVRRMARASGGTPVLLVLIGTATIAAFSTGLLAHVDRAAEAIAWHTVGAPFRVSGSVGRLPGTFDPSVLPGVTATAGGFRGTVPIGDKGSQVDLLALDVADYAAVVAGTPAAALIDDLGWHDVGAVVAGGSAGDVRPVVISTALARGSEALAVGDPISFSIGGVRVRGEVVAIRDDLPTLTSGGRAALIPLDGWTLATPPPAITTVFLRAPGVDASTLREAAITAVPGARFEDQTSVEADGRGAPVAQAIRLGVAAALVMAALYAALAVAAALALTGSARAVEAAHLRLLGLGPRDAVTLVALEYGPLIGIALALGTLVGLGLFVLVRPALRLDAIVGSDLGVALAIGPGDVALASGIILVVATIGIGLGALAERRAMATGAIRLGIERP